jgi:hypothetical protein
MEYKQGKAQDFCWFNFHSSASSQSSIFHVVSGFRVYGSGVMSKLNSVYADFQQITLGCHNVYI